MFSYKKGVGKAEVTGVIKVKHLKVHVFCECLRADDEESVKARHKGLTTNVHLCMTVYLYNAWNCTNSCQDNQKMYSKCTPSQQLTETKC